MRNAVKLIESHRQGGERQIFVDGLTVLRLLIWGSQHAPWGLILLKPRCSCEPKHYSSRSEVRSDSKQTHIQAERDHIVSFQTWTQAFLCKTHCAWSGESERTSSSTRDLQQPHSCSDSANAEPQSRGITLFLKRKRTLSEALLKTNAVWNLDKPLSMEKAKTLNTLTVSVLDHNKQEHGRTHWWKMALCSTLRED